MKYSITIRTYMFGALLIFCGCNDYELAPVTFDFELQDENGDSQSEFDENENVQFLLRIQNNSGKDIVWYDWPKIYLDNELFSVYKRSPATNEFVYFGTPLDYTNLAFPAIPAVLESGVPRRIAGSKWELNSQNPPIEKGDYKVMFAISGMVDEYAFSQKFYYEFSVK